MSKNESSGCKPAKPSPFTILVDSREQKPYRFSNLWTGKAGVSQKLEVTTKEVLLETGDYGIDGLPWVVIERKSKSDLYSSISKRRQNFEERLERMSVFTLAEVVVESEWSEIWTNPPRFTKFNPKSLTRTILAWRVRFPNVHWSFLPNRESAESYTYRLLERYWKDTTRRMAATQKVGAESKLDDSDTIDVEFTVRD